MARALLCGAIMVKNEAKVIEKTLLTIANHVKHLCVLDTGSTDGTQELVRRFCEEWEIELHLEEMEWVDFSTNRNHLLDMCDRVALFTLLMDANDEIKGVEHLAPFLKQYENQPAHMLFNAKYAWDNDNGTIGNSRTYYKPAVIRNNRLIRYMYPIHETLYLLDKTQECVYNQELIKEGRFYVYQDRAKDKSSVPRVRDYDIPTIKRYMEENGESTRMLRYLCQSLDLVHDYQELHKWTAKLKGYAEPDKYVDDIYMGYLWHARASALIGEENFHKKYIEAFQYSSRVPVPNPEPLYEGAQICLNKGDLERADVMTNICCSLQRPTQELVGLVINYTIYDKLRWLLLFIISHKLQKESGIKRALEALKEQKMTVVMVDDGHPIILDASSLGLPEGGQVILLNQLPLPVRNAIRQRVGMPPEEAPVAGAPAPAPAPAEVRSGEISAESFMNKTMGHKLYVLTTYRDRPAQLEAYLKRMEEYLTRCKVDFEIWVLEQADLLPEGSQAPFNKGMLYNVAAKYFAEYGDSGSYLCFQDVDTLPERGINYFIPDEGEINHLYGYEFCLGGAFTMRVSDFLKTSGFSNLYFNWGFEDNDFKRRVEGTGLRINRSYCTKRYDRTCFIEQDADPAEPARKMGLESTKVNQRIFERNVPRGRDGYAQLVNWKPFVKWIPWTERYSHFKINVAGLFEANRESILEATVATPVPSTAGMEIDNRIKVL